LIEKGSKFLSSPKCRSIKTISIEIEKLGDIVSVMQVLPIGPFTFDVEIRLRFKSE